MEIQLWLARNPWFSYESGNNFRVRIVAYSLLLMVAIHGSRQLKGVYIAFKTDKLELHWLSTDPAKTPPSGDTKKGWSKLLRTKTQGPPRFFEDNQLSQARTRLTKSRFTKPPKRRINIGENRLKRVLVASDLINRVHLKCIKISEFIHPFQSGVISKMWLCVNLSHLIGLKA